MNTGSQAETTAIEFKPGIENVETVIRDPANLRNACLQAEQTMKDPYVEVEPDVFDQFMQGQDTAYFMYGKTRVYIKGTKDKIEARERKTIYDT